MIVNKYANGNGGGGTGSTVTIDSALSSSSTNPVENRVITNALNSVAEQIPVVDSAVTSASTNAVQSQAVYLEIHGETASTQLEVSTATTEYSFTYMLVSNNPILFNQTGYFRETNLPGYYAFYLEDLTDTGLTYDWYMLQVSSLSIPSVNRFSDSYEVNADDKLASPMYFSTGGTGGFAVISNLNDGHLDGTMKYWFIIDTNTGTAYVYKNIPVIHEVTGGMPGFDDLPVAQDGSPVKYYVYDGGKKVLSNISYQFEQYLGLQKGDSRINLNASATTWAGNTSQPGYSVDISGNEIVPGLKTIRDSAVINDAENALSGFTEQVTLTVGSDSQNTIRVGTTDYNLKSTNDSRYLVLDLTALPTGETTLQNPTISGTTYRFLNTLFKTSGNYGVNGRYQLSQNGGAYYLFVRLGSNLGNNYLIIDTELLIAEISDSLTITRTKNIPDVLENYWTTGETQTAIQEAIEGAVITGATITVDDALSTASTNPVENRVITTALSEYTTNEYVEGRFDAAEAYTDSQVNNLEEQLSAAITAATQDMATEAYVDAAITAATQNFVTSGDVTTAITSATQNFITSGDVTNIVDAAVATAITIDSALSTGSTNPVQNQVITNALANFVQSTSVRTIVSCTQAQYDAMATHDPNTFYIITGVNS